MLNNMIVKSNVLKYLASLRKAEFGKEGLEGNEPPLLRALGYFGLVSLIRVQCLLGDTNATLSLASHLDLSRRVRLISSKGWMGREYMDRAGMEQK